MNYKTSAQTGVDRTIQLASHAALGCASASAAGGDCASGAVAGVVGELAAEYAKDSLYPDQNVASLTHQQKTNIKELAGLASGFSAIFTGNLAGLDDSEVADNIYAGQRIGKNAAANNLLYIGGKIKVPYSDLLTGEGNDYDIHAGIQSNFLFRKDSIGTDGRGTNFLVIPEFGAGIYAYIIPHGQEIDHTVSYGYRNTLSADYIKTTQEESGFGYTVGVSTAPITIIPVNTSISVKN